MKELALLVNNIDDLHYIDNPFLVESSFECGKKLKQTINSWNDFVKLMDVSRVYFGTEFCQFLLPSLNEMEKAFTFILDRKLKVSFVTPIVTDYGVKRLTILLDYISKHYKETEIIFNDWGVLQLIKEQYPDLQCVAGRLIDKTLRDPRLSHNDYQNIFNEDGLKYLQHPSITSASYQRHLENNGITRVELDLLPQGIDIAQRLPFSLSVYIPFGHVTTGRQCMMRMLSLPEQEKFILNDKCSRGCKKYVQLMKKKQGTFIGDLNELSTYTVELFRKGNTVFYCSVDTEYLKNNSHVDRIIYQPYPSI